MIAGIDIGGSKTLLATISSNGKILQQIRFKTAQNYRAFLDEFQVHLDELKERSFKKAAVAVPGVVNREKGLATEFGNLPWHEVPIRQDFEKLLNCPVAIENDAKLGGLSEASYVSKDYKRVLYITIGTGIGVALIVDGVIDQGIGDGGGKYLLVEHEGKRKAWESFASGRAIERQFGRTARDITDAKSWGIIASNLAAGLIDLIALLQPEVIIFGGGVGQYYDKFAVPLKKELKKYENPLVVIPPMHEALHPEQAVLYGCALLVKEPNHA